MRRKVETDPDFIAAPRYGDSLKRCVDEREPFGPAEDGSVPRTVARMLRMSPEEATGVRDEALEKLREEVKR